jgi:para-aminobenzoate synthetase
LASLSRACDGVVISHISEAKLVDLDRRHVRALVVDNYDSFTHNLVQCLAHLTGTEPTVVRNDDARWSAEYLAGFDCVVISPGPGRPDRPADFGIGQAVIDAVTVPLLGVCLGHQGICHSFGGGITSAPEPMHGRTSLVRHNGDELFAGVPSPFRAVRYHSLMVGEIPSALEVIAASDDDVAMALRHRTRPIWGVQFHPESILTEHGERLLANFVDLASNAAGKAAGAVRPPLSAAATTETPPEMASPPPYDLQVLARRVVCPADAQSVFDTLYRDSERSFWLDSGLRAGAAGSRDTGRFSFMGDAAGPMARTATADVRAGQITVTGRDGTGREWVSTWEGSFFDWLHQDLMTHRSKVPYLPFGFSLGWVGYLGYELKAETDGDDKHRSPYPDASMIFADRAIAFDHQTGDVYLLALADLDENPDADQNPAVAWLDETERRLASVRPTTPTVSGGIHEMTGLRLRHGRAAYLDKIAACKELIRAGETYEVCLTNMLEAAGPLDPWSAYVALRRDNPVPYGALLRFGDLCVLSASPERFLKIEATGQVESKPVKGTRPRGRSADEDERLRTELAASEKDRAENLMIVDLVRNDLGVTAIPGSVTVEKIFDIETFSTVHQMVSTIRSQLRPGVHAVECVRAAFPGGSMTGAPKVRTMRIIDELEAGPRGIYSGAIGYFALNGAADLSITIRTLVAAPGTATFGVGGAIVALSDPAAEFEETAVKAKPLLTLLGQEFPERYGPGNA